MNFIVTLSGTLKLPKHGTYALFRQSPIVYSFMKEKITKAINAGKESVINGKSVRRCLGEKKKNKKTKEMKTSSKIDSTSGNLQRCTF